MLRINGYRLPEMINPHRSPACLKALLAGLVTLAVVSPHALLADALVADTLLANERSVPIFVEADQFHVYLAEEKAVWRGNVTATQGNYTFRTSQLTVHLDDLVAASEGGSENTPTGQTSERARVELSADRVTYDLAREQIEGQGNSELRRGIEYIRADNIIYEVTSRIARAEPNAAGRVQVALLSNPGKPLFPGVPLAVAASSSNGSGGE